MSNDIVSNDIVNNDIASKLHPHWQLDHIGHAVHALEPAIHSLSKTLGFQLLHQEQVLDQLVEVAFLTLGNSVVELLAPLAGNQTLSAFLTKRGQSLHHLAYAVPSVSLELEELKKLGCRLVDQTPRLGARGHHVAFLHPSEGAGILIEICGPK